MALLRQKLKLDRSLYNSLFKCDWVVKANTPFGNPQSIVEYLGRYTHKVAISNNRIKAINDTTVTFTYKDYKDGAKTKIMTLTHKEFIRRFALHILPKRYVRMRHYGILSSTWKRGNLADLQQKLWKQGVPKKPAEATRVRQCPCCKTGSLRTMLSFDHRGPPEVFRYLWDKLKASSNA